MEFAGTGAKEIARTNYSIVSVARSMSVNGILIPSALAVLALMTKSRVLDCSTGRSDGFNPSFNMRSICR